MFNPLTLVHPISVNLEVVIGTRFTPLQPEYRRVSNDSYLPKSYTKSYTNRQFGNRKVFDSILLVLL
jgi:hypothetical protein